MLVEKYVETKIIDNILNKPFKPYPNVTDRVFWNSYDDEIKNNYISLAEKQINKVWQTLPAVRYMDFKRNGNRGKFQDLYFERRFALTNLVVAECLEGNGRFIDEIINIVWLICEESSWCFPAHQSENGNYDSLPDITNPVIDLFAADTGATLTMVYYLLKPVIDKQSIRVCERIKIEVEKRIMKSCIEHNHYHWLGFNSERPNNHTPWTNSNCLLPFLIFEEDNNNKLEFIKKSMKSLDRFIDAYPLDGGCEEGPGYWTVAGASLFDCLEMFYVASEGKIDVYNEQLIKNMGAYIYKVNISHEYYVNFADASTKVLLPFNIVYQFGKRINDTNMQDLAIASFKEFFFQKSLGENYKLYRTIGSVVGYLELKQLDKPYPHNRDNWLDKIEVMVAREKQGTDEGFCLAVKGGHNNEHHNHNDVGHFVLYSYGKPVIIDPGVEAYTAKTFSSERYSIWTMQSQYHNLPTINGIGQSAGREFKAGNIIYKPNDLMEFSLNIDGAYPTEANINNWNRKYTFNRIGDVNINVCDTFDLKKPQQLMFSLMTPCKHIIQNGLITFKVSGCDDIVLEYSNAEDYDVKSEIIDTTDPNLMKNWGDHIFRIVFKAITLQQTGSIDMNFRRIKI